MKKSKLRRLKPNETGAAVTPAQWNSLVESAEASAKALVELAKDFDDMRESMRALRQDLEREARAGHIGGD